MNRFLTGLCVFAFCLLAALLVITVMRPVSGLPSSADLPSMAKDRIWRETETAELATKDNEAAVLLAAKIESSAVINPLPPTMDEMIGEAQRLWEEERKRLEKEGRRPEFHSDHWDKRQVNRGTSVGAWVAAQSFVKDYLHCPTTAKYPWVSSRDVAKYRGGRWYVKSYVDAENLFGAKIRTRFTTVLSTSDDWNWTLHSLETD